MKVAILCSSPELLDKANALSTRLECPLIKSDNINDYEILLEVKEGGLQLIHTEKVPAPFVLNYSDPTYAQRWKKFHSREPLARALGIKPGKTPWVLDATAGFGRDTLLLARLGCKLTLIEQQPIIAAVLQDAIEGFKSATPNLPEIEVVNANSVQYLPTLNQKPDVIYLDPMFPKRRNAAEVKKASQWLRVLAGESLDESELLTIARTVAQRVVVKRPSWAPHVGELKPSFETKTEGYRFDIYL